MNLSPSADILAAQKPPEAQLKTPMDTTKHRIEQSLIIAEFSTHKQYQASVAYLD